MTGAFKAFLDGLTEAQKRQFQTLLDHADREQELYTVPLQSNYNTDEKSIEAIAYINNQFFETKFKHIVRSFFDVFPELKEVDGARESIEEILKRKVGVPMGAAGTATEAQQQEQYRTAGKRVNSVEFPIDKVNNNVWNLLSYDTAGQLTFNLNMASYQDRQRGKQVPLYYSINFSAIEDITITKQLTPYDKRVYIAIAALYNQGNTAISYSQIYAAMGNKKRPSAKDIDKIDKSVTKMAAAWLTMDNGGELKANYKYKPWKYDAALLPLERMRSIINGVPVENAIHLFREPPLVTFAKERKQLTTFDIYVLDTPVSKTDQNIMIEDYLLDAIAAIGHGRRNSKVLFDTLYDATKITTKKQKQRAPEKVVKILEYYQKCGLIKNYIMENDGVNITV